jgi:hypothetical protein
MKKLLAIYAILFSIFIHSSCSIYPNRIAYIPMNPNEEYPETSPDSVEIFITKLPTKPYQEMGIFYLPFRYNNYIAERSKLNISKDKRNHCEIWSKCGDKIGRYGFYHQGCYHQI